RAGANALLSPISNTTGLSTLFQYVQFQPSAASEAVMQLATFPPKNIRPRAPLMIAWYAMNLASGNVGKRSVLLGGVTPLQAICSIIQYCFCPLATCPRNCVQSPTMLISLLASRE